MVINQRFPKIMFPSIEQLDQRYSCQAEWSRPLREFLYRKLPQKKSYSFLEIGSGTGAVMRSILKELPEKFVYITGVDPDLRSLRYADQASHSRNCAGKGEELPFPDEAFDFVYCHYLLLWVRDPVTILREMVRVCKTGGIIAALSEPCYDEMEAGPELLASLARLQMEKLVRRGIDPGMGKKLGEMFRGAGLGEVVYDRYREMEMSGPAIKNEIRQMLQDTGTESFDFDPDLKMHYHVPTYFAYAIKK